MTTFINFDRQTPSVNMKQCRRSTRKLETRKHGSASGCFFSASHKKRSRRLAAISHSGQMPVDASRVSKAFHNSHQETPLFIYIRFIFLCALVSSPRCVHICRSLAVYMSTAFALVVMLYVIANANFMCQIPVELPCI